MFFREAGQKPRRTAWENCLGVSREPPSAHEDADGTASVILTCSEIPNRIVPEFEHDTLDSYTCASHPAHLVGHLSSVASMIESTDRVCGDVTSSDRDCRPGLVSENLKSAVTHQEEEGEREMEREMERAVEMEKEKELAREMKREGEREREMEREREREEMTAHEAIMKTLCRRRRVKAWVAAARSEKAREEEKKALAMTVEMEKERVRADAVGAALVAEEEAQRKGKAETTNKVQPKKKKKKAKEMRRKALQKVSLLQIFTPATK